MERYKNFGGNSGVRLYEIGDEEIKVAFIGVVYTFTYETPGKGHVERMKELALKGKGLGTYINQNVKHTYASKESDAYA